MRIQRRRKTQWPTSTAFEPLEQRAMLAGLGQDSLSGLGSTSVETPTVFACPPIITLPSGSVALGTSESAVASSSTSASDGSQSIGPVFVSGAGLPKGTSTAVGGRDSSPSSLDLSDNAGSGTGSPSSTIGSRSVLSGGALNSERMEGATNGELDSVGLATSTLGAMCIPLAVPVGLSASGEPKPQSFDASQGSPAAGDLETPSSPEAPSAPDRAEPSSPSNPFVDAVQAPTGPPPIPVPGSFPEARWKWCPNPQNPRGGAWYPMSPVPGRSPPIASWEPPNPETGRPGHWDVDDGEGGPRQHYDKDGKPMTSDEAHGDPKPPSVNYWWVPVVGVGGYVTYRAVRMLPSFLPPLWPTIPVNFAIP